MLPPILTEKIDKLHFSGLYLTLFLVSSFLFIDCFALTFWGFTVAEVLNKPTLYKNIVLLIFYLIGLYLIVPLKVLIRVLIATVTPVRWYKIEDIKKRQEHEEKYYTYPQLLNDAIEEDNKVKLQISERAEANSKQVENIKTLTLATLSLLVWNYCLSNSVMHTALEYKNSPFLLAVALVVGAIAFSNFWKGNDSVIIPLIKRTNGNSYNDYKPKRKT